MQFEWTYLTLLEARTAAILKYFASDLVPRVLKVHDGIRYLDADGVNDGLNVERTNQSVGQDSQIVCNNKTTQEMRNIVIAWRNKSFPSSYKWRTLARGRKRPLRLLLRETHCTGKLPSSESAAVIDFDRRTIDFCLQKQKCGTPRCSPRKKLVSLNTFMASWGNSSGKVRWISYRPFQIYYALPGVIWPRTRHEVGRRRGGHYNKPGGQEGAFSLHIFKGHVIFGTFFSLSS